MQKKSRKLLVIALTLLLLFGIGLGAFIHANAYCDYEDHDWTDWIPNGNCDTAERIYRVCKVCEFVEKYDSDRWGGFDHKWADDCDACANGDCTDDHFTVDKEPTCTEPGEKSIHCTRQFCSAKKEITEIPIIPHEWEKVTISATCTKDGLEFNRCSVCGEKKDKTKLPALGHDWNKKLTVDLEPTCTEKGSKSIRCLRCDNRKNVTPIRATGHKFVGEENPPPTCTEPGVMTFTCQNGDCEKTYTKPIKPLGHDWGELEVKQEPTCDAPGVKTRTCNRCDEEQTRCIKRIDHNWDEGVITRPPTCTKDGETTFTCLDCGAKDTENIPPALGHDCDGGVVTEPTCVVEGKIVFTCQRCGEKKIKILPINPKAHNFNCVETTLPTCTEPGVKTCTCKNGCGKEFTKPIPADPGYHDWVVEETLAPTCVAEGIMTYTCQKDGCGLTKTEFIPIDPDHHLFEETRGKSPPPCKEKKCLRDGCSYTEPGVPHNWGNWILITAPTCTEPGEKTRKCKACAEKETVIIEPLGHNWYDVGVEDGVKTFTCKRCGETRTEPIPSPCPFYELFRKILAMLESKLFSVVFVVIFNF